MSGTHKALPNSRPGPSLGPAVPCFWDISALKPAALLGEEGEEGEGGMASQPSLYMCRSVPHCLQISEENSPWLCLWTRSEGGRPCVLSNAAENQFQRHRMKGFLSAFHFGNCLLKQAGVMGTAAEPWGVGGARGSPRASQPLHSSFLLGDPGLALPTPPCLSAFWGNLSMAPH